MTTLSSQPLLHRRSDDRIISGLSAGVGDSLGVPAAYVRAAFVTLSLAGGVGVFAYLIGWFLTSDVTTDDSDMKPLDRSQRIGLALMFIATLMTLSIFGVWFGDSVVWPIGLMAFGLAAIWDRSEPNVSALVIPGADGTTTSSITRIVVGSGVLITGVALFAATRDTLQALGLPLLAVTITAAGLLLLLAPWIYQLVGALDQERNDRIRSEERSDVAAHLHDSVLQTLALIQRSDDPKRMVTLARAQERELRHWLFAQSPEAASTLLSTALEALANKVEDDYDVRVEVVTVGDAETDDSLNALVQAAGEAAANAARHSGADRVSVYAETKEGRTDVFVSDQGKGFDIDNIDEDRHGISDSILGRMKRHGGEVTITSEAGEGTEIHLSMALASEAS